MMTIAVRHRLQPPRPTLQSRRPPPMPTSYQFRPARRREDGRCCSQQHRKRSSRRSYGCPTIPKTLPVSSACRSRCFDISLTYDRVFDGQKKDLEHVNVHVCNAQSIHWSDSCKTWCKGVREVEHSHFRYSIAHIICMTYHTLAVIFLGNPPNIGPNAFQVSSLLRA